MRGAELFCFVGCQSRPQFLSSAARRASRRVTTASSPNDLLDFRIFQEPDFDAVIRVSGDGSAIFPMIGRVHVAGMTITQATETLRQRYMGGYLANPQVNLTVRTYAEKIVYHFGSGAKTGDLSDRGERINQLASGHWHGRRLYPDC